MVCCQEAPPNEPFVWPGKSECIKMAARTWGRDHACRDMIRRRQTKTKRYQEAAGSFVAFSHSCQPWQSRLDLDDFRLGPLAPAAVSHVDSMLSEQTTRVVWQPKVSSGTPCVGVDFVHTMSCHLHTILHLHTFTVSCNQQKSSTVIHILC